jgi:hypothetical protein
LIARLPKPRSSSQAVIFFFASALVRPLMIGELTAVPSPVNPISGSSAVG